MWHGIAPRLALHHTVVAADLRGYGDSSRPPAGEDHAGYSFRTMAADQVTVMAELGYDRSAVVGHDRGARVAHRMALDHPDAVERLAVQDILPTLHVYSTVDRELATRYYHWFLFIQPADLPERLIAADPSYYLHTLLRSWVGWTRFTPRRSPSTSAASPTRTHGTRCWRTTGPARRSTCGTTRPTSAGGSQDHSWCCGGREVSWVPAGPPAGGVAGARHRRARAASRTGPLPRRGASSRTLAALAEFLA